MVATPWAVLLIQMTGEDAKPNDIGWYERFLTSDSEPQNMVDYFRDVSNGNIDISGSKVFGWYTLKNYTVKDYNDDNPKTRRSKLIQLCKDQARSEKGGPNLGSGDLSDNGEYFKTVICLNVPLETYGGVTGAVLDAAGQFPSIAGQEMGHGYGLDHSMIEGSSAEYMDRWDTMSTRNNALMEPNGPFGESGPYLNAANMDCVGWLPPSRVWTPPTFGKGFSVELRPLARRDLPGYIAAWMDPYYVEFRVPEKWDRNIGRPVVLVHTFDGVHSVLMNGVGGKAGLVKGDAFDTNFVHQTRVEVVEIDASDHVARLSVEWGLSDYAAVNNLRAQEAGILIGGVQVGAPGWRLVGRRRVPIPPHGPDRVILQELASLQAAGEVNDGLLRHELRKRALTAIRSAVNAELQKMSGFSEPGPVIRSKDRRSGKR
jgi:hypothetical protein